MPITTRNAEEALIGVMLLTPKAVHAAVETVGLDDFTDPGNRAIFEAIIGLLADGDPIDPLTVASRLYYAGTLDLAGGQGRLLSLQALAPATYRAAEFAAEIRGRSGVAGPTPDADSVFRPAQANITVSATDVPAARDAIAIVRSLGEDWPPTDSQYGTCSLCEGDLDSAPNRDDLDAHDADCSWVLARRWCVANPPSRRTPGAKA